MKKVLSTLKKVVALIVSPFIFLGFTIGIFCLPVASFFMVKPSKQKSVIFKKRNLFSGLIIWICCAFALLGISIGHLISTKLHRIRMIRC